MTVDPFEPGNRIRGAARAGSVRIPQGSQSRISGIGFP